MELETSWLSSWDGRASHMRVAAPAGERKEKGRERLCEWYGSHEEELEGRGESKGESESSSPVGGCVLALDAE